LIIVRGCGLPGPPVPITTEDKEGIMAFNPLREKGIPIDKQFKNWVDLNSKPYDKETVHPYTRTRGILMNGIEVEAMIFKRQFARNTSDMDLRRHLALTRRVEQEQQKAINWMIPGDESNLEVTLGYEQVAVDLTAFLARNEHDPYVKQALDFALLEDFDHLYRYANLMKLTEGKEPSSVTKQYTEITVGRPTALEHRHPFDDVRDFTDFTTADPATKMHILTIVAAEQQTMNYYMNIGDRAIDMLSRGLYLEIAQIEEQHVSHYESLLDPNASWFENLLLHEYNECYLYYSLMQDEPNAQARALWEESLAMEIEHLKMASELMKQYEKQDPEALLPQSMPEVFKFQSNVDYIRDVLASQITLTGDQAEFVPAENLPKDHRYFSFQSTVNAKGSPSETVIDSLVRKTGNDYRQELAGPHPIKMFQQAEAIPAVQRRLQQPRA
jgi:rubrerythrin